MKKIIILSLAVVFALLFTTSCDKEVYNTYYISLSETSENFNANAQLMQLVSNEIYTVNMMYKGIYGTEEDALEWFYNKCQYMESPLFTSEITVVEDTYCTLSLKQSTDTDTEDPVIASSKVEFAVN